MKSSKVMKDSWGKPLISIQEAGARGKKIRAMKNELMSHYLGYHLPSKQPEYQPYTAENFDEFAEKNMITRAELELWVDKSLATVAGAKWLDGQTKALNKTFDPEDCPEAVRGMWKRFLSCHAEETVETVNRLEFESEFCCKVLDSRTWDVSSILADSFVKSWRREGKTHMYFWFLFRVTGAGVEPMRIESHKLKRVFDALEYRSGSARVVQARSPAVLITDAIGFYDVLTHLKRRQEEVSVRLWDYHVINYIPDAADNFPKPAPIGSNYNVFVVLVFAYNKLLGAQSCFHSFFTSTKPMQVVYRSEDMEEIQSCYRRHAMPWFSVSAAIEIFSDHLMDNMVIVNVKGGPELAYVGLV